MSPHVSVMDLIEQLRAVAPRSACLRLDSRDIVAGDIFLACPGMQTDGRDYIEQAVAAGASAVVFQSPLTAKQQQSLGTVPALGRLALRQELGALADAWWDHPSAKLTVIAVTGTNGKTSVAQWLGAALRQAGSRCGVIGTLGITGVAGERVLGQLTTPDVVTLHRQLAQLHQAGATHVVMEASSIGLDQGRLDAVTITLAVFTNLTQDHLDYHVDMSTYASAKARLFERPELRFAVVNADDVYASRMTANTQAVVQTYGMSVASLHMSARNVQVTADGMQFELVSQGKSASLNVPFLGQHNVSNVLAVASALQALGWTFDAICGALTGLPAVPGRLERVEPITDGHHPLVWVDYAHTPDALARVLQALKPLANKRSGKLWCVIGCGGNRDASKRPLMAQAAVSHADHTMLTSDNPRHEDPATILQQMRAGVPDAGQVTVEIDRAVAIVSAILAAQPNDVILLAGKGHETSQEVGEQKFAFDDRQWARLGLLFAESPPVVQTDSRALLAGSLFVALRGDRFDGHAFLAQAQAAGARAALVEQAYSELSLPQIVVGDTRLALQKLATAWRGRFQIPVIGVTGSNGKTTTKEMIASMLRHWFGETAVLWTQGNLNNDIGVPLTVLRLRAHHQSAVIELGMNHPGEIAVLSAIAQPTIGLVLNAQREHQEFMQSVQAVALENGSVFSHMPRAGVAVFPASDTYTELWAELASQARVQVRFGVGDQADVCASHVDMDVSGSRFDIRAGKQTERIELPIAGIHNVFNATAAAACALAAGAPLAAVVQALGQFQAVKGRMQTHRLATGQWIVDDTYNANPDSVRAAIDVLAGLPAPRALVLGDMGEVGDQGPEMHAEVGDYAKQRAIDYLCALGNATPESVKAFGEQGRWFEAVEPLCAFLQATKPVSVLVKGSRFMAMERVVATLLTRINSDDAREAQHAS
jgi:murE/murF fusion protein